ncbi:Cyanophycinase [Flavobacterium succinicans]|uniref:Cyanophycinase n=1 Tax=Flavobacterium succinicans TaxID=29536 RepID=A0A1I4TQ91_9FLAO|nr:cyanophycinase [Flavobacterium succinicans]SFM78859.1 Cyanophycinase [Flavobacterium succinicans]
MFPDFLTKPTKNGVLLASSFLLSFSLLACSSDSNESEKPTPTPAYTAIPSSIGIVGDPKDVTVTTSAGTVLMGGSTDVDGAMKWMINKSIGGDVVIIRASGTTGYNQYLYDLVKVNGIRQVNSVETLLINSAELANNPKVAERIKEAEMLFIAGGDQANYIRFWRNTPVEEALNYLINVKKVPVGGTSAGCAILGEAVFTAENNTITSEEALLNPFNSKITLAKSDFINNPFLKNTITDTHYNNPDRKGRQITFLARLATEFNWQQPKGIGVQEQTAVCIDENGKAVVYGTGFAYFLKASSEKPEKCVAGSKLNWINNKKAVQAYLIGGKETGNGSFNLTNWTTISGGIYQNMYVTDGVLSIE